MVASLERDPLIPEVSLDQLVVTTEDNGTVLASVEESADPFQAFGGHSYPKSLGYRQVQHQVLSTAQSYGKYETSLK